MAAAGANWAQIAGKFLRGITEGGYGKLRESELGSQGMDFFISQRREFMRGTPEGARALQDLDTWTMKKNQLLGDYVKPLKGLADSIKDDPQMLRKNLTQIDSSLPANHPGKPYSTLLMNMGGFQNLTPMEINQKMMFEASRQAQIQVFRRNNAGLLQTLMPLFESSDPVMHTHANAMLDIFANQFRDTEIGGRGARGLEVSKTKMDIRTALYKENKRRAGQGLPLLGYNPSKMRVGAIYQKQNDLEKLLARRTRFFLAPLIFFPHLATFFNYSWAPLTAIGKTLSTLNDAQLNQLVEASGIFNAIFHSMLDEEIRNSAGVIGRTTKPVYGRVAGYVFHTPGFNLLRKSQLHFGGILGYHSAQYWADAALRGDQRAIEELKEMHIDITALRQRGHLSPADLQQAIWHFVNNRAFIDRAMDRALTSTRNPWMRLLTMFHGYVMDQQALMRRELHKMLDAGDYKGIARFAGTVGIAFPAIAPMLKSLEVMARNASVQQGYQSLGQDYRELTHPKSARAWMLEYIDMISMFGSIGTFHSYLQAAQNDRLALAVLGPVYGSATRIAQDITNYAIHPSAKGKRNIRPLAKDVLQQTIPGGNILSNRLFPAKRKRRSY